MWERTLQDLIRGLRANKADEASFIAQAVLEIRKEIKSKDMQLKAGAVLKLTYLEMLGYDMSWASFHVVEVMSSARYHIKTVGYLAAAQSFTQDTDVLMLTTNLLKKDLSSTHADIAITLNGLSQIVTHDLARDLSPELIGLLNHSRPNIRKRATVALYKIMIEYPELTEVGITRMREKLEDSDPCVVAATVNVLCEFARRNPQDCLALAPPLFHLLTTSTNNWMLIKIVKLFASLTPYEPRLVKKLQPPLTELISTTKAISLLYECVHTSIIGGMLRGSSGDSLARMCVSKLAAFVEDEDQNLKYYALLAMEKIVPSHPHLIAEYQHMILASVDDQDISIRMRALDLLSAMIDQQNIQSIIQQLLSHLLPDASNQPTAAQSLADAQQHAGVVPPLSLPSQSPAYRLVLARRILSICSKDTYDNVTNFEWYLSVLVDLAHIAGVDVGAEIQRQLVDVAGRVRGARRFAVQLMAALLTEGAMLREAGEEGSCVEVLWAAAWICGEYCSELADPHKLIQYLLDQDIVRLPPDILALYIQAVMKIFGYWATELAQRWNDADLPQVKALVDLIMSRLKDFVSSPHVEVQERAANALQLFSFVLPDLVRFTPRHENTTAIAIDDDVNVFASPDDPTTSASAAVVEPRFPKSLYLIGPLFLSYELNPVAPHAHESVPVPEGLDLDAWIVPPTPPPPDPLEKKARKSRKGKGKEVNGSVGEKTGKKKRREEVVPDVVVEPEETVEEREERERQKAERLERMRDDPYYIVDDRPPKTIPADEVDDIPVVRLDDLPPLPKEPDRPKLASLAYTPSSQRFVVDKGGEMPAGQPRTPTQVPSAPASRPRTPLHAPPAALFQLYDAGEDDTRPSTPDPIKVTRAKKGSGKKRTPKLSGGDSTELH